MNKKNIAIVSGCVVVALVLGFINIKVFSFDNDGSKIQLIGDTIQTQGKVTEFEYGDHIYLNITKTDGNGIAQSFVVHSPGCKCTSTKLNNITTVITKNDNENKEELEKRCVDNFTVIINKLTKLENDNKTLKTELASVKAKLNKPVAKKPAQKKPVAKKPVAKKPVAKKK